MSALWTICIAWWATTPAETREDYYGNQKEDEYTGKNDLPLKLQNMATRMDGEELVNMHGPNPMRTPHNKDGLLPERTPG